MHLGRPVLVGLALLSLSACASLKMADARPDLHDACVIEFDTEHFGQAANNGQMIEELSAKAKAAPQFRDLAMSLANRRDAKPEKKPAVAASSSALGSVLAKLKLKR